ncbi:MAG: glutamyl-tRNA reductase [Candidatus Omnitrophota bacterium]|mgnify:CR=1 FL=1
MDNIIVVGINHRTAPVEVREKFSFSAKKIEESLIKLKISHLVKGAVILSTCNRSEIYFDSPLGNGCPEIKRIKSFIFEIYRAEKTDIDSYFYSLENADALKHLFRVASGLDSQVLGETQILGQIKSAWLIACNKGISSDNLNIVFKKAQEVGKRVRVETGISQGNISLGSVAINILEERFNNLQNRTVLIIGAGKIGTLVSKYLKEKNMHGIFVANRSHERALELAKDCSGKAVAFSGLEDELKNVDITISSTSSPHIVLRKDTVERIMKARTKPLFIMDLALPRDVDPAVNEIAGVSLCDLDDLKYAVSGNQNKKKEEALQAEKIVQGELNSFLALLGDVNEKTALQIKNSYANLMAYEFK